jgi:NAD(P)-dependent dehydrogenase (short-subunit alcohol dehydrogenase family)
VALVARTAGPLEAAAREIAEATGRTAAPVVGDTGDDGSVKALVQAALVALGGVDILVNNAATPGSVGPAARIEQFTTEILLEDVNVKVAGYLRTAQAVAPLLVAGGWGRIINIGGLAARNTGNYVGSIRNSAISALTKNPADELGPAGINVTAIHPGATRTEKTTEGHAETLARANTIGRLVDAADIA